ncbi:axial regulator YABBY 4 [Pistacia vera]|uniref:axial regulator YABBY 4 n=1 Tax=Pistacia vera TaxID=55513 RepID=UPI001263862E|nr:axial regulator YABBY 4 [Pistacia vera]
MSTLNRLFDLPEQICYVQCSFCTTILLVSVPCGSLSMVVTVRCGHCTSLLSVNMMKASFLPLHLLASLSHDDEPKEQEDAKKALNRLSPSIMTSSDNEEESCVNHIVNKPPEKRQRAPSAYNSFIKEEIRRLKAENPNMAHKEAFSTAAKNWAHFPPIQYKGDGESCGQEQEKAAWNSNAIETDQVYGDDNNCFRERKSPMRSIRAKTPFE